MRKSLTKKTRFEVFKRDKFTCQYCGKKAPDIVLQVDHIEPVSKGGTNEILNLITSCADCNSGKSNRKLSDNSVFEKQRQQLEDLQEREEQIKMLFEWKKSLMGLEDQIGQQLNDVWLSVVPGYSLTHECINELCQLTRRFSVNQVVDAIHIAARQYLEYGEFSLEPTPESVKNAWSKIGGICVNREIDTSNPDLKRLRYIRGILRNRLKYIDEDETLKLLEQAYGLGAVVDRLEKQALAVGSYSNWRDEVQEFVWCESKKPVVLKDAPPSGEI